MAKRLVVSADALNFNAKIQDLEMMVKPSSKENLVFMEGLLLLKHLTTQNCVCYT